MTKRCPTCGYLWGSECNCSDKLDSFLRKLHEELQQDQVPLFTLATPWGKISLHWDRK